MKYSSLLKIKLHLPRKCVDLANIYQHIYQHLPTKRGRFSAMQDRYRPRELCHSIHLLCFCIQRFSSGPGNCPHLLHGCMWAHINIVSYRRCICMRAVMFAGSFSFILVNFGTGMSSWVDLQEHVQMEYQLLRRTPKNKKPCSRCLLHLRCILCQALNAVVLSRWILGKRCAPPGVTHFLFCASYK